MDTDELISMVNRAHTIASQQRMPFQPTEHGYSNYQDGCLAVKNALIAMLAEDSDEEVPEIFPGTISALDRLMPNVEGQGPAPTDR